MCVCVCVFVCSCVSVGVHVHEKILRKNTAFCFRFLIRGPNQDLTLTGRVYDLTSSDVVQRFSPNR